MSSRPELPVKLYYRIGEVAEVVGVEPHVLRYWESEFGSIRPQKSPKGQRVYSRRDLEKLMRVRELLYEQGYTIAGAKKRLRDLTSKKSSESPAADEGGARAAAPLTLAAEPPTVAAAPSAAVSISTTASAASGTNPAASSEPGSSADSSAASPQLVARGFEAVRMGVEARELAARTLELAEERGRRSAYERELLSLRDLLRSELAALDEAHDYFDVDG